MDGLEASVEGALDALASDEEERSWGDPGWTRKVKEAVAALASEFGHNVYASDAVGTAGGEWLFDLTWLDYSRETKELTRSILVLESEWGRTLGDVLYDFQKLLLARADLRVMVFQVPDAEEWERYVAELARHVACFEQGDPEDRYLLSGWIRDGRTFRHRRLPAAGS